MAIAWAQEADFEEGDLTDFDSTVGAGLDAHANAAKNGSWGFRVNTATATNQFGELSDPTAETEITTEFWFNINSATMSDGDSFNLVSNTGSILIIQLRFSSSVYQVRARTLNDSAGNHFTTFTTISDGWHLFQLGWKASSGVGQDDGYMHLFIDGVLTPGSQTGLDTDTLSIPEFRFGATGVDAGTSGFVYYDDCRWVVGVQTEPKGSVSELTAMRATGLAGLAYPVFSAATENDRDQVFLSDVTLQIELGGPGMWVDVYTDTMQNLAINENHGIPGNQLNDRVGGIGTIEFGMINSEGNTGGLLGYYSLDHVNTRPGWKVGIGVRWVVSYSGVDYPLWLGTISIIDPDGGQFGRRAVSVRGEDFMRRFDEFDQMNLVPLQQNVRADEVIEAVLDKMIHRPENKSLDTGRDILPVVLDKAVNSKPTAKIEFNRLMQSIWGYLFVRGDGTLVFQKRAGRLQDKDVKAQIIEKKGVDIIRAKRDISYRFTASYFPIDDTGGNEIVFTSHATPFEVLANSSKTIKVDYTDPDNKQRVGVKDVVTLTADTDFKFGSVGDGSDNSKNGDLDLSASVFGGTSAEIVFENTSGTNGFVNLFQIRAVVLRAYDVENFEAEPLPGAEPTNITLAQRLIYQADPLKAQDFANAARERYGVPRTRVRSIRFFGNENDEAMKAALTVDVGMRIQLVEKVTGVSEQLFVQHVSRKLTAGRLLECKWIAMPSFDDIILLWDIGKWDKDKWGF